MLRVVSIPAGHPYVERVTASPDIHVLPDPRPDGAPAGQWWPPVALDPAWIRQHATSADLVHIHFGTESFSTDHLVACLAAARDVGWPVVYTVHDIEHPQLTDQSGYLQQLDVLIPGADAVVTLTPGAAAEIRTRWNRDALVSPHPALLPPSATYPEVAKSPQLRIGMHLKDLRSNIDGVGMVTSLGHAMALLAEDGLPARAEIRLHHRVRNTELRDEIRHLIDGFEGMVLIEHDRPNDEELWNSLAAVDVCVLPYDHGTHSGWLELCWDLAVPVVVPSTGYYREQHTDGSVASFTADADGLSLASAITAAVTSPGASRAGSAEREREFARRRAVRTAQAETTATVHANLYSRLLTGARS